MTTLRTWLKQEPKPYRIVGVDAGGDPKTVRINGSKSQWRDAENALRDCVRCEAFNSDGESLRVWDDPEVEIASSELVQRPKTANTELVELGRLLNHAADSAVDRMSGLVQQALEANAALVRVLSERNQQLERAWQRMLMNQEPTAEGEASPGDLNQAMVLQLLQVALGGGAAGMLQPAPQQQKRPPQQQQPPTPSNGQKQ